MFTPTMVARTLLATFIAITIAALVNAPTTPDPNTIVTAYTTRTPTLPDTPLPAGTHIVAVDDITSTCGPDNHVLIHTIYGDTTSGWWATARCTNKRPIPDAAPLAGRIWVWATITVSPVGADGTCATTHATDHDPVLAAGWVPTSPPNTWADGQPRWDVTPLAITMIANALTTPAGCYTSEAPSEPAHN